MRHFVLRGLGIRSNLLATERQQEVVALGIALWVEENLPSLFWLPFIFSYCAAVYRTAVVVVVVVVFSFTKRKAIRLWSMDAYWPLFHCPAFS